MKIFYTIYMRLYNSLTKTKQEFITKNKNVVNMYVCGPTVYDYLHLGNFRGAIFFNALRNFLEYQGYKVNFAYNYTDVDDKIITRAKEKNISALELSDFFIKEFEADYKKLKLQPHTYNPKVSQYIPQMIKYIEEIIAKGNAYENNGSVYIRRSKFSSVGLLSGRDVNQGLVSNKNEISEKEHPSDFALWKASASDEIGWESAWGKGRPGWHLECSVMIHDLFQGQELDIHGGGLDLMFPHHENECYQCIAHGELNVANFWVHNQMLNYDGQKMSKSLGNTLTGRDFINTNSGELLKFIMLSHHYRSIIDFGPKAVENSRIQLGKIYFAMKKAQNKGKVSDDFHDLKLKTQEALNDDFNTPEVMTLIHESMSRFYKDENQGANFLDFIKFLGQIFNLFQEDSMAYSKYLDTQDLNKIGLSEGDILNIIEKRNILRKEKNYTQADDLRKFLIDKGINLLDVKDDTFWEIIRKPSLI